VLERAHLTHPRDLSRGQQTAVAIALQLSHKPAVLALDEPTRGLDSGAKAALAEVLACVQETGTAILSASHDDDFVAGQHDHLLRLVGGTLVPLEGGVVHA
jgi:energy-coupling factor transport system ATP-binding protein